MRKLHPAAIAISSFLLGAILVGATAQAKSSVQTPLAYRHRVVYKVSDLNLWSAQGWEMVTSAYDGGKKMMTWTMRQPIR